MIHVGWTGSPGDLQRRSFASAYLASVNPELDVNLVKVDEDFVELREGRDFLKETQKGDIVVLHFVYRHSHGRGEFGASPESSWGNWRRRLTASEARYIFPFGRAVEVSGTYLSVLDGYRAEVLDPYLTVFIKDAEEED